MTNEFREVLKGEIMPRTLVFERGKTELSFSFAAPNTGIILKNKATNEKLSWIMTQNPYLPDSFIASIRNNLDVNGRKNTYFHFHTREGAHKVWLEETDNGNFVLNIQPVKKPKKALTIELTKREMNEIVDHYHSYFYPKTSS